MHILPVPMLAISLYFFSWS